MIILFICYTNLTKNLKKNNTKRDLIIHTVFVLRPIGGGVKTLYFTKINFGFFSKALNTYHKPDFTELKMLFNF